MWFNKLLYAEAANVLIEVLIDEMTSKSHDCKLGRLSLEEENAALIGEIHNLFFSCPPARLKFFSSFSMKNIFQHILD